MEEPINFDEACRYVGLLYFEMQKRLDRHVLLSQARITELEQENAALKAKLTNDTSR